MKLKKTFDFGKIDYTGTGRKAYPVTVDVELRQRGGEKTFRIDQNTKERIYTGEETPVYVELSICGDIWNTRKTDCYCGGQCLDDIAKYRDQLNEPELFDELYRYWKLYHLNGMHAGTPEQEKAIDEWKAAGNKYEYSAVCEMLKERGLYEVSFTGITTGRRYENEMYKYGHAWIVEELPGDVLLRLEHMLSA